MVSICLDKQKQKTIITFLFRLPSLSFTHTLTGGWGPEMVNDIYCLDGACLPKVKSIPVTTVDRCRFKYGFTAIALPLDTIMNVAPPSSINKVTNNMKECDDKQTSTSTDQSVIVVYGGITRGGYVGDING